MTKAPFFSVIIPVYNRAELLPAAVNSVLQQTFEDFELIIVNDGSNDHTPETINKYKDELRVCSVNIQNSERGAARNAGIKVAKGQYVTFLDSDDRIYSTHLQKAFEVCRQRSYPEVFRLAYEIRDDQDKVLERAQVKGDVVNERLLYGNVLACLGVFVKKDIIKKYPFNEDRRLAGTEDYELWLRLGSRYPIWNNNTITAVVCQHSNRSVLNQDIDRLIQRIELLLFYVFNDEQNRKAYELRKSYFKSFRYSYVALHAVLAKQKVKGIRFLIRSFLIYPPLVFYKRFYVILFKTII